MSQTLARWWAAFALVLALCLATAAHAQTFPKLTGRVVDEANLLTAEQRAALSSRLEQFETQTGRQIVVATIASLQDYPIEDYGYQLGRSWGIGQKKENDGALVIVAPAERKMRIEVGYGLEPYLTDALSSVIIREQMRPRFKAGDYYGGIDAALTAMFDQLKLPPEQAEARQKELLAKDRAQQRSSSGGGGIPLGIIFWVIVAAFVFLSMRRGRKAKGPWGARRYDRDNDWPVWLWVASEVADAAMRSGRGGGGGGGWSGGGGGGWGGGGGGGFSGGGGSFGGGGASGDW